MSKVKSKEGELKSLRTQVERQDETIKEQKKTIEEQEQLIKELHGTLGEARDIFKEQQKERTREDIIEAGELVAKISKDSKGFLSREHLSYLSLDELRLIRNTFLTENAKDYLAYFERRRAETDASKRKRPGLSVGDLMGKPKEK